MGRDRSKSNKKSKLLGAFKDPTPAPPVSKTKRTPVPPPSLHSSSSDQEDEEMSSKAKVPAGEAEETLGSTSAEQAATLKKVVDEKSSLLTIVGQSAGPIMGTPGKIKYPYTMVGEAEYLLVPLPAATETQKWELLGRLYNPSAARGGKRPSANPAGNRAQRRKGLQPPPVTGANGTPKGKGKGRA